MLFPFLLVAGPQLNAVVLQGSARFAQGFDSSARQVPETGEQMILGKRHFGKSPYTHVYIVTSRCLAYSLAKF